MTRISKQGKMRALSPKRPRPPSQKTGSKKDALEFGFKPHLNACTSESTPGRFISKIGSSS